MSGYLKQYWKYKQDNYDRILLVRRGRFFDSLFEDALTIHKVLDYGF